jgi:metal-responsive CopG/Arc/MetJ family transcriptional regulator
MTRHKKRLDRRISCSIDEQLLNEVQWITDHFNYNRSALIRELLTRWLDSIDEPKRAAAQRWHQQNSNKEN